jgi:hypothetical protein
VTLQSDTDLPLKRYCTCWEAAHRWNKLAIGQGVVAACPREPLQHEPLVEERILVMNYATTQAQPKGVSSMPHRRWGLAEATLAKAMSFSPPPTVDEVDKLYRQLEEIHTIGTMQLAECPCSRRSAPAPSPVQARTGRLGPDAMLSVIRMARPTGSINKSVVWCNSTRMT